jgi:uncharacterized membrane protein
VSDAPTPRTVAWLPILLLVTAALLLRFANLGGKSLWIDEGYSVYRSTLPAAAIWSSVDEPIHPPLYYLLLHYWPYRQSEFGIRLPSALASSLTVAVLYLIAARRSNRRLAISCAALLAVSPMDIWYAQEARMFAVATLAIAVAVLGLVLESGRGAVLMALGLTVGLYTYYAVIPLWLCLSAVWLAWRSQQVRAHHAVVLWLIASTAAAIAFAPQWPNLVRFIGQLGSVFSTGAMLKLAGLPAPPGWLAVAALAVLAVFLFIATLTVIRIGRAGPGIWLSVLLIAGFALATALVPIPRLYSLKRVVLVGWPYVTLLVGWLLVRRLWLRGLSVAAVVILSLAASIASIFFVPKSDFRSAVGYLNAHARDGDVVWMTGDLAFYTYSFYRPQTPGRFGAPADLQASITPGSRIWFIVDCPRCGIGPYEGWLERERELTRTISFDVLDLRLYEPE